VTLVDSDLVAYRAEHPLCSVVPVLRDLLGTTADDGQHLWAVTDAAGRLLWVEGHRGARARAARANFVEGAQWDEAHAGTNAPGTALAVDHEVQIFAAEHYRPQAQTWSCAAAPIHDPMTGRIVGVVDVTGGDAVAHPHSLALVRAAARLAEAHLAWHAPDPAALWRPTRSLRLEVLGRTDARLRFHDGSGAVEVRLPRRHAELLTVLTAHRAGVTGEQLASLVYADETARTTVRVELARLRRLVGDVIESRPYRLTDGAFSADYLDVADALDRGELAAAVTSYPGPLLPGSDAPGVIEQRLWLETRLRAALLVSAHPPTLYGWASGIGFDDLAVWERLSTVAPAGSLWRETARARVRSLQADYGLRTGATLM
jgi:hypothetical protein